MVFNILIDNTDGHEKNHALLVDKDQRYRLSPAYDMLPSGQALGYQQMRVGRDGADSTLENARSECRSFALTPAQASVICREVAAVTQSWKEHFRNVGVTERDIALLAEQLDRPFLMDQRRSSQ